MDHPVHPIVNIFPPFSLFILILPHLGSKVNYACLAYPIMNSWSSPWRSEKSTGNQTTSNSWMETLWIEFVSNSEQQKNTFICLQSEQNWRRKIFTQKIAGMWSIIYCSSANLAWLWDSWGTNYERDWGRSNCSSNKTCLNKFLQRGENG